MSKTGGFKMIYFICSALLAAVIILAVQSVKWYIATIALIKWISKAGLTPPTLDEIEKSVGAVVGQIIKKIFKR